MDPKPNVDRIRHNWGFGMSPIKPDVQAGWIEAARTVRVVLSGARHAALGRLDDISTVKGLFTRSFKRDQWNWFTVWAQLGFPAYRVTRQVSPALGQLRVSIQDGKTADAEEAAARLTALEVPAMLDRLISGTVTHPPGYGFIYILSTRKLSDELKIGYTNRDVATRVKEINSASGIATPFGARAAWMVPDAKTVESEVHAMLDEFRMRRDREFFNIPFGVAVKLIDAHVETLTPKDRERFQAPAGSANQ